MLASDTKSEYPQLSSEGTLLINREVQAFDKANTLGGLTTVQRTALSEFFGSTFHAQSETLPFADQLIALAIAAEHAGLHKDAFRYFADAFNLDFESHLAMFGISSVLKDHRVEVLADSSMKQRFDNVASFVKRSFGARIDVKEWLQHSTFVLKKGLNDSMGGRFNVVNAVVSSAFAEDIDAQQLVVDEFERYESLVGTAHRFHRAMKRAKVMMSKGIPLGLLNRLQLALEFVDGLAAKERTNESSASYFAMKGHIYMTMFHFFQDAEYLRKSELEYYRATKLYKGYPSANRGLAEVLFLKGKKEKALSHAVVAIENGRDYPYAYITKGVILWNTRNTNEALTEFVTALETKNRVMKLQ